MEIILNPTAGIAALFKLPNTCGITVRILTNKVFTEYGSFTADIITEERGYIRRWLVENGVIYELVYKDEHNTVCSKELSKTVDIYIKDVGDAIAFKWKWEDFATT